MFIEIEFTYLWAQLSSMARELLEDGFCRGPKLLLDKSVVLLNDIVRYLICKIAINQNHPFIISRQFMFSNPVRLALLLPMTTLSGKPLV
jgi:hypothetical protein